MRCRATRRPRALMSTGSSSSRSRALRRIGLTVASLAVALIGASCSLVIDVPADCEDSRCAPYRCDSDGVACASNCVSDTDCATGFLCNGSTGVCEDTGCVLSNDTTPIELPDSVVEFELAAAAPFDAPDQLLMMVSNRNGLGFRRYRLDGSVVNDPIDDDLDLVRVVSGNDDRRRFFPTPHFLERTETGSAGGTPRFVYGVIDVSGEQDTVGLGTFVIDPATSPRVDTLWEAARRRELLFGSSVVTEGRVVLTFSEQTASDATVYALTTDLDGTPAEPVALSASTSFAEQSAAAAVDGVPVVVFASSASGERRVEARPLLADELGGVGVLVDSRDAQRVEVENLQGASLGQDAVFVWLTASDESTRIERAVIDVESVGTMTPGSTVALPMDEVMSEFGEVRGLQVVVDLDCAGCSSSGECAAPAECRDGVCGVSGTSCETDDACDTGLVCLDGACAQPLACDRVGYAIATIATYRGRRGLWLQRFTPSHQLDGTPLPLLVDGVEEVDRFRVAPTRDGWAVAWDVDAGQAEEVFYRRFSCGT